MAVISTRLDCATGMLALSSLCPAKALADLTAGNGFVRICCCPSHSIGQLLHIPFHFGQPQKVPMSCWERSRDWNCWIGLKKGGEQCCVTGMANWPRKRECLPTLFPNPFSFPPFPSAVLLWAKTLSRLFIVPLWRGESREQNAQLAIQSPSIHPIPRWESHSRLATNRGTCLEWNCWWWWDFGKFSSTPDFDFRRF